MIMSHIMAIRAAAERVSGNRGDTACAVANLLEIRVM